MKSFLLAVVCLVFLAGCSLGIKADQKDTFEPRTHPQTVFVVPFTTIMVPDEVRIGLFNLFVDRLNDPQSPGQHEYVILKQGLDEIEADWLVQHDYIVGEVFAYVEELGSTMVSIRAKSRISLFQQGHIDATLKLDYPVEIFYEKDYMTLEDARRKLALKISDGMSRKLQEALAGS